MEVYEQKLLQKVNDIIKRDETALAKTYQTRFSQIIKDTQQLLASLLVRPVVIVICEYVDFFQPPINEENKGRHNYKYEFKLSDKFMDDGIWITMDNFGGYYHRTFNGKQEVFYYGTYMSESEMNRPSVVIEKKNNKIIKKKYDVFDMQYFEANYTNNIPHGICSYYESDGKYASRYLRLEISFENGIAVGIIRYRLTRYYGRGHKSVSEITYSVRELNIANMLTESIPDLNEKRYGSLSYDLHNFKKYLSLTEL
jgi:hypothetical protein